MFTGQGSQVSGMGKDFFDNFDIAKKVMHDGQEGFNSEEIMNIMFDENRIDDLNKTINTQPAIMINAIMIYNSILDKFPSFEEKINCVAGHSVGEYNGLCIGGFFDVKHGVKLLKKRAELMESSCASGLGGMIALLGCNFKKSNALIKDEKLQNMICEIANDNGAEQIILSGQIEAIDLIPELISKYEIKKAIKLKVSGPFHSSMMANAKNNMSKFLENFQFNEKKIKCDIIPNYNLENYSLDNIKTFLSNQIIAPVRWRETILKVYNDMKIKNFVEIGPSPVLTNLAKKTLNDDSMKYTFIGKISDLDQICELRFDD
jgi:malonyl CoA-acyl carrier protein transacylase